MARKKRQKNTVPKFTPDYENTSKRVYSNLAEVRTTGLDFTLIFMDVSPPIKEEINLAKGGKPVPTPVQCSVVIPSSMVLPLINALQEQYEKFEKKKNKSD